MEIMEKLYYNNWHKYFKSVLISANVLNQNTINLKHKFLMYAAVFLILINVIPINAQTVEPKKVIYETDMTLDVDDVGGLALLHALANEGKVEILAVCYNEEHPNGAGAIDAINTWYGRGDIPVGVYKGNLSNDWSSNSSYLEYLDNNFPDDLNKQNADSALTVYRRVLSEQPDSSVTIISVGFTNNLNDLLLAEPDLIKQKVVELVQMAGVNNDGFNFVMHNLTNTSKNVLKNWPTPLAISQEGGDIYTGDILKETPIENPVRWAFYKWFGNKFDGRSSWDELAVLYGVLGESSYFRNITSGTGSLDGYVWRMQPGYRSYINTTKPNSTFKSLIENLMIKKPIGAYFEKSSPTIWVNEDVEFDASVSVVEAKKSIVDYLWNFGDGTVGNGEKIIHKYTTPGKYTIKLTIVDDFGDSLFTSETIQTSEPTFSTIPYFGSAKNYLNNQPELWGTFTESNDLRLALSNSERDNQIKLPGYTFIKDSSYSDFVMNIKVKLNESLVDKKQAEYAIIFGYEDENNYNKLVFKNTLSTLVNVSHGLSIDINRTSKVSGIPDENYHIITVEVKGDSLNAKIDAADFFEAKSSRLIKNGQIGFGSTKYALFFDDVNVKRSKLATDINDLENAPNQFKIWQNYPNPFNPTTTIKYQISEPGFVSLKVYDILGKEITTLVNDKKQSGIYSVRFNSSLYNQMSSGIYIYRINVESFERNSKKFAVSKKMLLLK